MVPPKDEESLEEALERLVQDPGLREEMGNRGRQTAVKYDWERVTAQISDYYNYLLTKRPSSTISVSAPETPAEAAGEGAIP